MVSKINLIYFISYELMSGLFSYVAESKLRIAKGVNWLRVTSFETKVTLHHCPDIRLDFYLSNFSISIYLSFIPFLCVLLGEWRWEGLLCVCFILLGTTLLPDNSLKTGKNAT